MAAETVDPKEVCGLSLEGNGKLLGYCKLGNKWHDQISGGLRNTGVDKGVGFRERN